jgi:hypothetical protein
MYKGRPDASENGEHERSKARKMTRAEAKIESGSPPPAKKEK